MNMDRTSKLVLLSLILLLKNFPASQSYSNWPSHGGDLWNRRFAKDEHKISSESAPRLTQSWKVNTGGDVSATPAVYKGMVIVPTWTGLVLALTVQGALIWKVNLTRATGFNATLSRTTPSVTEELALVSLLGPARVVALDRLTGGVRWISEDLDETPLARITMSGTIHDGDFYVGISSLQEVREELCCTFQGSFQKLDVKTGKRIWKTLMIPDSHGSKDQFSGVAVWGSSPAIDERRGLVYIATGNLYTVPEAVQKCIDANLSNCIPSGVCDDAVVALRMEDGGIEWCNRLGGNDLWRLACVQKNPPPNCPAQPGPDYDFGEAPMILTAGNQDIVVTGQKSGFLYAHERTTGRLVWQTVAGPGGSGGGATWGAATDGKVVYTNIVNNLNLTFTLVPSKNVTHGGGWVAIDAATGAVLWSAANPTGARAHSPVTIANGVLFVASFDAQGHVYALRSSDGGVLWTGTTNATQYGGFSVADGCAFVGSGYVQATLGPVFGGTLGQTLYAFCVE